jgi:putative addiction module CopG family antidote
MNVTLAPNLKRLVEEKVKSGRYKNADDVIGDALRLMREKDGVSETLGIAGTNFGVLGDVNGADIGSLAFLVLMQATRDAEEDLKEIMNEVKARNAAKRKLRELQRKVKCDIANSTGQTRPKFGPNGMGTERAYHHVLMPVMDPCSESGVRSIETDWHQGRIADLATLESIRDKLGDELDNISEFSEMDALRLQMIMDRRSKIISTLSNILKKVSSTGEAITQNLK